MNPGSSTTTDESAAASAAAADRLAALQSRTRHLHPARRARRAVGVASFAAAAVITGAMTAGAALSSVVVLDPGFI
jgi:hypothetical protein